MNTPPRLLSNKKLGSFGGIEVIFGPMFSGKTTEMFRRIKRYTAANKKCLIIKYAADSRYSKEHASSHDREMLVAQPAKELLPFLKKLENYDVIGIDEGQFYPDLVEFCQMAASIGKILIISALDGDFRRKPFGRVLELIPLSEKVTKLSAVCCVCFCEAHFTRRISKEQEVTVIGGSDKYIAVCRACYENPNEIHSPSKLKGYKENMQRLEELRVVSSN